MTTDRIALALAGSITEARTRANINKSTLARLVGVVPSAVTRWENGERRPSLDNLVAMSIVLETSFVALTACIDWEGVT